MANHLQYLRRNITLIGTVFLLLLGSLSASAQTDRLTAEQVAKIKSVGAVAMSPDGRHVAYTVRNQANPAAANDSPVYHLFLYDRSADRAIPYVTDTGVSSVTFRPQHGSITFLANKPDDSVTSLYEISLTGGEARKIYSFDTSIRDYNWAPDGNRVAFTASEPGGDNGTDLPYEPEVYEENLTHRRGYVANVSHPDIDPEQIQVEGTIYDVVWAPDGNRMAVAAAPTPLIDDFYMGQQVYLVNDSGTQVTGRVNHDGKLGQILWSPDSDRLAMIAAAHINDPIDGRLMIVSAEGGDPSLLKREYEGAFEQVAWVDDNTLGYLASKGVWSTYGQIDSDGSSMQTIVETGGPNIQSFSRAKNGATAFVASTASHPAELYLMEKSGEDLRRVTNSNPWLDKIAMGRQETVTYRARDGMEIQGILIYPVNYREGERYPLITDVHGGPEAHEDNGWLTHYSAPGQVAAGRGYAVFYPNYRGSTGRGLEYAMSSQGDLAGAEFDDIVDGVDHLVERGIVDSERVGVTGGSYGGYATGWLSTRYTDRFAAGVMFVGISDNISKWGTSDIPEELYLVHARKRIWENYQFFLERSPIYHAGEGDTPLLIMAGKEDTRVDPGQSYELYRHLKTRTDTPVRLVLYPGEGHGNAHATARYDYNIRMMRWFDTYLKEGNRDSEKPATTVGAPK